MLQNVCKRFLHCNASWQCSHMEEPGYAPCQTRHTTQIGHFWIAKTRVCHKILRYILAPSWRSLVRMASAIGSSTYFWIARRSGRAPNCSALIWFSGSGLKAPVPREPGRSKPCSTEIAERASLLRAIAYRQ